MVRKYLIFTFLVCHKSQVCSDITVGVCKQLSDNKMQVGVEEGSYGYNGSSAQRIHYDLGRLDYGSKFEEGDVIGCGVIYSKREIFFTKNGEFLGTDWSSLGVSSDTG